MVPQATPATSRLLRFWGIPIKFMFAGVLLKGLLVMQWKIFEWPDGIRPLLSYDAVAVNAGFKVIGWLFPRGIAPAGANEVFEIVNVIVFGIECFVAGALIQFSMGLYQKRSRN
jgi:hypothetical protein